MECKSCGTPYTVGATKCMSCGNQLGDSSISDSSNSGSAPNLTDAKTTKMSFDYLPAYYQVEFSKMETGSYQGKLNWAAFFLTWIWAFIKNLWLLGVICLVSTVLTKGILAIVWLFYFGFRGNYLYYKTLKTGKQAWI